MKTTRQTVNAANVHIEQWHTVKQNDKYLNGYSKHITK